MPKRALLLINRNARQGKEAADTVVAALRECGIEIVEDALRKGETCSDVVLRHRDQVEMVIIAGGDGTLNSAVDGIVRTGLPIGILPLGTANDLARTLELPIDLLEACRVIGNGDTRTIDVGQVNGKHFLNVASIGLSVEITKLLTKDVKKAWGVLAYFITALKALYQVRLFRAEIRTPSETFHVRTIQIAIGNGVYYGGGMAVAEDAEIDDRHLDLYSLELTHWWQLPGVLLRMRSGALEASKYARTLRGKSFEIVTRHSRRINTDGELTGRTPASFKIVPQALKVFVPAVAKPVRPG